MRCAPSFTKEEIEANHEIFDGRRLLYKDRGVDFLKVRRAIIDKAGPLKGPILDIGAGKGIMALCLARAGYSFASVDKDQDVLRIAALNLAYEDLLSRAELHVMDAYSLEFADNSFDSVFLVEALHHMDDIDGLFSEIDRVLRPGGRIVLSDFNEKGMEIVDSVHDREGHKHRSSGMGKKEAEVWLNEKNYSVRGCDQESHWILIGEKRTAGGGRNEKDL